MKYKIILKSFFVLMLILAFSFNASASEITGSLSTGGTDNIGQINGFLGGSSSSPDTGSIGGSVSGGSSGGQSSGGASSGTSLSTSNGGGGGGGAFNRLESISTNLFSSDNTALIASSGNLTFSSLDSTQLSTTDRGIFNSSSTQNDINPQSLVTNDPISPTVDSQTAQTINAFSGISTMSWVWISLILLLLITTVAFMYNRNRKLARWSNI